MKNTIITLASLATLAVSANAQTIVGNTILSVDSFSTPTGGPNNAAGLIDGVDGSNVQGLEWNDYTTDAPSVVLNFSGVYNITKSFVSGDYGELGHSAKTFQLEFFSGTGGTGSSVGVFNLNGFNDQALHEYNTVASNVQSMRWTPTSGGFDTASPNTTDISEFQFSGTAVPEPSSTALLGLGGLALLTRRKK